ncbi:phage tail assembly protein [Avibacterium paragallinarum]|uniref:Uncharacterized protein n=1 Tax=Avibacterium paragallinarum TaxID=728 RepID=A0AAE5WH69_AVIPA|nr:phage tail assembly protein [Avibacterium paragallinarum]MEE3607570.1 phage tail assembly protein [Avibacterium paragallinarum]MEE3620054.1 phage tail assembly protein [Avibacterium paragallinarum]MEE3667738.1 phage tail assembly protein [Avibacterium paragallinarum]MEE3679966.1 phage tail assembly protein [Avibacterium paragallinarum]MEE4384871.1 phage tail assembly protein [Avibacterium paragallinarum]
MDGRLLLGLPINGQRYFDFKVHLLTLGDECNALEMIAGLGIATGEAKPLTQAEKMLMDLAYLCQQVEFVGVDKQYITPEYLLKHLATDDYLLIAETILALRKKHIAAGESQHQENSHAPTAMT